MRPLVDVVVFGVPQAAMAILGRAVLFHLKQVDRSGLPGFLFADVDGCRVVLSKDFLGQGLGIFWCKSAAGL